MFRHKEAAASCAIALIWMLTAAGTGVAHEAERSVSDDCLADPAACLEQKRLEFETRGTLGLDLHPKKDDGDGTTTWTVHRLIAGSAADQGGLVPGDILLRWNGELLSTPEKPDPLQSMVADLRVGDTVEIQVLRQSETVTLTVTAQAADEETIEFWLRYFANQQHFDDETIEEYFRKAAQRSPETEPGDGP